VPLNFVKGIAKGVWEQFPTKKAVGKFLRDTEQFFSAIPTSMLELFERIPPPPDKKTAMRLVDQTEWIEAFRALDFDAAKVTEKFTAPYGPYEVLRREHSAKRKELYRDFVHEVIPEKVRDGNAFKELFGGKTEPSEERLKKAIEKRDDILGGMRFILGVADEDVYKRREERDPADPVPISERLAERVIREKYLPLRVVGVLPAPPSPTGLPLLLPEHTVQLHRDYEELRSRYPGFTAEQLLSPHELLPMLPPSYMRGALRMGLLNHDRLKALRDNHERKHEGQVSTVPEVVNAVDKAILEREAVSFRKFWYGLKGFEKFALVAAAGYLLVKKPNLGLGVAAAYFARKFFFGDPRPLDTFGELIQKGVGKLRGAGEGFLERFGYEPETMPEEHARLMHSFMNEKVRENLTQAAVGFGILANAPLSTLARSFEVRKEWIEGEGILGTVTAIDAGRWVRESELAQEVEKQKQARKLDRRAVDAFFLNGPEAERNRRETADALTHVFYLLAAREEKYAHLRRIVERAVGDLPAERGGRVLSYDDIRDPEAREAYLRLVLEGQNIAAEESDSFAKIIGRLRELAEGKSEERVSEDKFEKIKDALEEEGLHVSIDDATGEVIIDLRVGVPYLGRIPRIPYVLYAGFAPLRTLYPLRKSLADFASSTSAILLREWREQALDAKKSTLEASTSLRMSYAPGGAWVEYERPGGIPPAGMTTTKGKSPSLEFLKNEDAEIQRAYNEWIRDAGRKGEDPLVYL
jgi:hypothetical protein